jgi:hypothetical protein
MMRGAPPPRKAVDHAFTQLAAVWMNKSSGGQRRAEDGPLD